MEDLGDNGSSRMPALLFPHQHQLVRSLPPQENQYHQGYSLHPNVTTFGNYPVTIAMPTPLSSISVVCTPENIGVDRLSNGGNAGPQNYLGNVGDQRLLTQAPDSHRKISTNFDQKTPQSDAYKNSAMTSYMLKGASTQHSLKSSDIQKSIHHSTGMNSQSINSTNPQPEISEAMTISSPNPRTVPAVAVPPKSSTLPQKIHPNSLTVPAEIRHEMLPHHFQNTIAKARQVPDLISSGAATNPEASSAASSSSTDTNTVVQVDLGNPLQNMVLASMLAAVSGKVDSSVTEETNSDKKKKRGTKKLRVKLAPGLPTMVPPLLDPSEKPYQCPDCPKKFSWQYQLHMHAQSHSTARPFVCQDCKQAYKRREHLQRHVRVHTGERPFECKECGKKYRRQSQLVRHARAHTGERPYLCNICTKSFRRRGHLCRHTKTHANEILKKSGINPASLAEATALLNATMSTLSQPSANTKTDTGEGPLGGADLSPDKPEPTNTVSQPPS